MSPLKWISFLIDDGWRKRTTAARHKRGGKASVNTAILAGALEDEIIYLSYVLKSLCWDSVTLLIRLENRFRRAKGRPRRASFREAPPPTHVSHTNIPPLLNYRNIL